MILQERTKVQYKNKPLHFCRGLFFVILHNGGYCQNIHNISRKMWTIEVECGKICIGEQPGLYTWRLDGFAPAKRRDAI